MQNAKERIRVFVCILNFHFEFQRRNLLQLAITVTAVVIVTSVVAFIVGYIIDRSVEV
jgi:hypothetical protein